MFHHSTKSGFSIVELLATIAIGAMIVACMVFFVASYVQWAQNTADKHTYEVLNDSLTRYKTQGGGVSGLTQDATIGRILAQMQTSVAWGNTNHQFLAPSVTYRGRSIGETGIGARYHFSRFNTYSDGSGDSSNGTGGAGSGICYMANGGASSGYVVNHVNSSSGYWTYLTSSGAQLTCGSGSGTTIPISNSVTFWASDSSGVHSGNITLIDIASGSNVTTANFACAASTLTKISFGMQNVTSPVFSNMPNLQTLDISYGIGVTSANFSNDPALQTLYINNLPTLTSLSLSGDTALTMVYSSQNYFSTTSAATLNTLYQLLPPVSSAMLDVASSGAAPSGSNPSLLPVGWTTNAP